MQRTDTPGDLIFFVHDVGDGKTTLDDFQYISAVENSGLNCANSSPGGWGQVSGGDFKGRY